MEFTQMLTDIGTGIVDFMETVLPGMAGTVTKTFDAFAFSSTADGSTTVAAAFGWFIVASVVGLGIGLFRRLFKKVTK